MVFNAAQFGYSAVFLNRRSARILTGFKTFLTNIFLFLKLLRKRDYKIKIVSEKQQ
jgi:hypothetical protein